METNEALPTRETNPADFAWLEGHSQKSAETQGMDSGFRCRVNVLQSKFLRNKIVLRRPLKIDVNLWHTYYSF